MDSDIDMDFSDVSDDGIQSFLTTKLEAIRLQNEALQTVLEERQKVLQQIMPNVHEGLKVENVWKKVFNRKYAIGFEILSSTAFENVRVVLTCEFEDFLRYKVQTFSVSPLETPCTAGKNCPYIICGLVKKSDQFESRAYIVISFNLPQFLKTLEHDIIGHVICTLNGQDIEVPLPNLHVAASDSVSQTSNWLTQKNSLPNLFTMVLCSNVTDLVMCLPEEWTVPLTSTFEIHCSLTYFPLTDTAYYFIANKISQLFDNTLVIVHPHEFNEGAENDIFIKVYTSDDQQLFAFLHHLLSCVPNSVIFPSTFYKSAVMCNKASYKEDRKNKALEDFEKGMRGDIDLSYYYAKVACWQNYLAENRTYRFNQQRQKLSEQESETDLHYSNVIKM